MAELDLELLLSLVKGLGAFVADEQGDKLYSKDADCTACLKDLQRLLRQDTESREAFQVLGQYNIAKSDLVPIILTYPSDTELVYNALKVLTYLTMPVDSASDDKPMQAEYMQRVKESFMAKDAMAVIVGLVAEPLSRHPRMTEADGLVVQLVITFFRNLLTIPDRAITAGSGGDHRSKLRQALLTRMFDDNVMELLLVIAQHASSKPFRTEAPLLMEIFQQVFKNITAAELAEACEPVVLPKSQHRRGAASRPAGSGFKQALQKVTGGAQLQKQMDNKGRPARHARFGGLFVRRYNADDKGALVRTSALASDLPVIPELKKTAKFTADEQPAGQLHAQLLWKLRKYLDQLLQAGSFSTVMAAVLQDLKPGLHISRLTREDFVCFFRLANLATAYVRIQQERTLRDTQKPQQASDTATSGQPPAAANASSGAAPTTPQDVSPFACLSSTMGWDTFHMVHVLWIGMVDTAGKPAERDWGLQHESLGLLKEMLFALDLALHVGTPSDKRAADRLQRRLLHDDMKESGLLPVMGRLLKSFNFAYQPRSHACDLVQALHVVLRMLDRLNASEAGAFLVKQATRGGGPRTKKKKAAMTAGSPDQADGDPEPGHSPNTSSGKQQELSASPSQDGGNPIEGGRTGDPFEEAEQEEEQEERRRQVREVAYDLQRRLKQELAFPTVIHFYTWLLQGYATNDPFVNHCLAAFLRRIASSSGLDLEPMLYQLSMLRVFQAMLADKVWRKQKASAELVQLATHITRNLFARLVPDLIGPGSDEEDGSGSDHEVEKRQRARKRLRMELQVKDKAASMMFIELMFWKPAPVAQLVKEEYNWRDMYDKQMRKERGYGSDADSDGAVGFGKARPAKGIMTDQQAEELKDMFEEVNGHKDCLQQCVTGMGGAFSKAQISRQLKSMGLKKNRLTPAQEEKLRELYGQYSGEKGYLASIAQELMGGFSKGQIGSQLRKLGLRPDKGKKRKSEDIDDSSGSSSGSDNDSESDADSDASDKEADAGPSNGQQAKATDQPDDDDVSGDTAHRDPSTDPSDPKHGCDDASPRQKKSKNSKKRNKQDATKKLKRQRLVKKKTAVTDWTSDDSSDAGPAAIPDQLNPMPDSDADDQDSAAASPESNSAGGAAADLAAKGDSHSKCQQQQSKRRLHESGSTKKAGRVAAAGSVSDGGSESAAASIPDVAQALPDCDISADADSGSEARQAGAHNNSKQAQQRAEHEQRHTKRAKHAAKPSSAQAEHQAGSSAALRQGSKQGKAAAKKQRKRSCADAHDSAAAGEEARQTPSAETARIEPGQKPRRRLRKAAPTDAAATADASMGLTGDGLTDDTMVDLEDPSPMGKSAQGRDPPETWAKHQDSSAKPQADPDGGADSNAEDLMHDDSRIADAQAGVDDVADNDIADQENTAPASKSRKRLKKQSAAAAVSVLPSDARSALEALRLQRMQKQGLGADAALRNASSPAPVQDTLPSQDQIASSVPLHDTVSHSNSLMQNTGTQGAAVQTAPEAVKDNAAASPTDRGPGLRTATADTLPDLATGAKHCDTAPVMDTLPEEALLAGNSEAAPMQDTLADRHGSATDTQLHGRRTDISPHPSLPRQQDAEQMSETTKQSAAPITDTLDGRGPASHGVRGEDAHEEHEDDDLIRQAMTGADDEGAVGHVEGGDEDSELLQQLLNES